MPGGTSAPVEGMDGIVGGGGGLWAMAPGHHPRAISGKPNHQRVMDASLATPTLGVPAQFMLVRMPYSIGCKAGNLERFGTTAQVGGDAS